MHVVVVGAGLAGVSVACALAGRATVTLVDRGPLGAEASSDNAGMLRRMGEDPYERALALRTHERLVREPWLAEVSRACGAVLAFGRDPGHLHDAAAHLRWAGVPHRWVERFDEVPALAGSPVLGGWWLPEERVVDPWALLQVLWARARAGGVERVRDEVAGIVTDDGRVTGVQLAEGRLAADAVVLAAGAWSAELAARVGAPIPLVPLRRSLVQTAAHALSSPDHPWCWVDDEGVYVRPESGGWLISGCDEAVETHLAVPSRGPVEAEGRALALHKLQQWFPALGDATPRGGWTGLRTFAPDRRPVLGLDPAVPGLWWAAGLGGFGVSCGLAAGEAVAAWLLEGSVDWISPRGVSPRRPMLQRWMIRPTGDLAGAVAVGAGVER
jgi:glycine/D-amino acid oxidase-like deaminating enzyme